MKDNNKRVFLGIIIIATLVITIIGGTFAFFSASGGSANNAITANATTLSNLGFTSSHSKVATNLVPVASQNEYFYRYPGIASSGAHSCIDDVGNEICSIYEFTITNTASVAQTIYVSFVPSQNTFDNMYFAAFNTSIASASYVVATGSNGSGSNFVLTPQTTSGNSTLGHQATKLTKNSTDPIAMPGLSTSLNAGESVTYTILVWLQETGSNQNTEQGGQFKAGVNVTTGNNSTGVTGVMGENSASTVYVFNLYDEDVSGYNLIWNGQAIPSGITQYSSASSAMAAFGHPGALKLNVINGIVEDSYVVFEVTPAMASANSGMQVGTYELKGESGEDAYSSNASILTTAFGPDICKENDFGDGFVDFYCEISDLLVVAYNNGEVGVSHEGWDCTANLDDELISYCTEYEFDG